MRHNIALNNSTFFDIELLERAIFILVEEYIKEHYEDKEVNKILSEMINKVGNTDYLLREALESKTAEFFNMAMKIARSKGSDFHALLILTTLCSFKKKKFKSIHVVKKEDVAFIVNTIEKAVENGYISNKKQSIANILFNTLRKEDGLETVEPEQAEILDFISEYKASLENVEYIVFTEEDEIFNFQNYYNEISKTDFKEILLSDKFAEFVKSQDAIESLSDIEDVVAEFIDEDEDDFLNTIVQHIFDNDISNCIITQDKVESFYFGDGEILLDLI